MARSNQNDLEYLRDLIDRGEMTADEANVEKVRMERVLVVSSLPRDVRSALNRAVKNGFLGHKKKDGLRPEVYYHPSFEHLAIGERSNIEREKINALKSVFVQGG